MKSVKAITESREVTTTQEVTTGVAIELTLVQAKRLYAFCKRHASTLPGVLYDMHFEMQQMVEATQEES